MFTYAANAHDIASSMSEAFHLTEREFHLLENILLSLEHEATLTEARRIAEHIINARN